MVRLRRELPGCVSRDEGDFVSEQDPVAAADSNVAAPPRLVLSGISKDFHGITVLDDVDLQVAGGEVHAVVGENGAGKSTLMKIVAGVHAPTSGTMTIDGEPCSFSHPLQARQAGVSIVFQELNLLPERTVTENLYLGSELRSGIWLDRAAMEDGAATALADAGAARVVTPRTRVKELSIADQQVVEIARALMAKARLVIFDEPTAALSGAEADELFARVRQLAASGISVLYVSHRLPEVFALSERITVLKDGRLVSTLPTWTTTRDEVVAKMVGRELSHYFPPRAAPDRIGPVRLQVSGGSNRRLRDIDLTVRGGEILGVVGLAGSGRTELAQAIFGVEPFTAGTIELDGAKATIGSPRAAVRSGLAFVTEDRKVEGLILGSAAMENAILALRALGRSRRRERLGRTDAATRVADLLLQLDLRTRDARQPVGLLSGGNQQKVVLAKWMSTSARVLLFDEPTRGIDVGAKSAIHDLLRQLASEGLAVLMISSELPEAIGMSDRLVVMRDGRISGELPGGVTETEIMMLATAERDETLAMGVSR